MSNKIWRLRDSSGEIVIQGTPAVDVARDLGVSVARLSRWLPASERSQGKRA
ncbi:hypothetical protein ABH924_004608 [Arthrobacter sp. GAS37]|uniref:hypothetical protein n=1 Tax=Arthrobacter sp. GAS37 TaxID=3156261 RepID=UPI003838BB7C